MPSLMTLAAALLLASASAAETVLGVYVFHRHGDRTAKAWEPVNLTALGADEVYSSGSFYRQRYFDAAAALQITGISADVAAPAQLAITAPVDTVLHDSAISFMQGVYPPLPKVQEKLANGSSVVAPLNGYQYVPVNAVADAAASSGSESTEWLQADSGCSNAVVSSNNYLVSDAYTSTLNDTQSFYQSLEPVISSTYQSSDANFENAYGIFDLINVATIHNASIPSPNLLTQPTLRRLYDLASTHEWNLAYNASDAVRSIDGLVLAGQVIEALEAIVNGTAGAPPFNAQFGSYNVFMSFFGNAGLQLLSNDFYGVCNYASSMAFELVTNASSPSADDVSVRFYFANGTTAQNPFNIYPLFGQGKTTLPWTDFKSHMNSFAIQNTTQWCGICGNTDGQCASNSTSSSSDSGSSHNSGNGISKPVAGVIGALVTLVVILGLEALVMLAAGFRVVKKSTVAAGNSAAAAPSTGVKA